MTEEFDQSITTWIGQLKDGEEGAATELWSRYFDRLTRLANRKLGRSPRRVADEEDIAISVFQSLCEGANAGRFPIMQDRDDLWRMLVVMTARKAVDLVRRETSQKRGGGMTRGNSVFAGQNDDSPGTIEEFIAMEPTADFIAMLDEQFTERLDALNDPTLRQIANWRLEGRSNEEIAELLNVSLRTVERKLRLIRENWSAE